MSSDLSSSNILDPITVQTPAPKSPATPPSADGNITPPGFGFEFEYVLQKKVSEDLDRQRMRLHKYSQFGMDEYDARRASPEEMREKYYQLCEDFLNDVYTPSIPTPSIPPTSDLSPPTSDLSPRPLVSKSLAFEEPAHSDETGNRKELNEARENAFSGGIRLHEFISTLNDPTRSDNPEFWQEMEKIYKQCHIQLSQLWLPSIHESVEDVDMPDALLHTSSKSQTSTDNSKPFVHNLADNLLDSGFEKRPAFRKQVGKSGSGREIQGLEVKAVIPKRTSNDTHKVTKSKTGRKPTTRSSIQGLEVKAVIPKRTSNDTHKVTKSKTRRRPTTRSSKKRL
ncbi:hypothetical protein SBOR_8996 [Sclerotinia borealis F-4128]|uniref:Uncharacterized protein n=1 Tax=Sclerotinia borealis (strain F-4128) TaxID=1432307 RepID=W9C4H8_SCLBF|nr:hypothetical protein SBOR_8996 [Sclerotinia borealis F-4128]